MPQHISGLNVFCFTGGTNSKKGKGNIKLTEESNTTGFQILLMIYLAYVIDLIYFKIQSKYIEIQYIYKFKSQITKIKILLIKFFILDPSS